ncbi:hypothetical protein AAMO2058_000901100 [Amorphochlora amoebiformis]|uniref:Acetohydroxy-acid reductoisomerase n=1 Tax=Amorphochlora amoebiformis TaxID=1561963 RepID=A0A6T6T5P8_9EUKA|mmetsp:Transcript_17408/g.27728  ORF Transcript_17408/g.27728 Transcript_17408/m.27728 type:complete len:392 (+) Transcript_17408:58-1233(+)
MRTATRTLQRLVARRGERKMSTAILRSAAIRPSAARRVAAVPVRGYKMMDFGGTVEKVIERSDYPADKLKKIFPGKMALLGYGTQGRGQALNMRDQGLDVIIGLRKGRTWELAKEDGWVEGESLFEIEEAAAKGDVIMYMLSDAGQSMMWSKIAPHVTKGKTLYFSHGFSVVFSGLTGVVPPEGVDVILAAPKGSGTTVRRLFQEGRGINASCAVYQDASGDAETKCEAIAIAVGAGYVYKTTFEKEVHSDLTGERGVLMGAIAGMFKAQYDVLRDNGHSPSEAFNETVEEATQSLYPLIGENGMDWMFANCSTTAQRGALDWAPKFEVATKPVFEELYARVVDGSETQRSLDKNSQPNYHEELQKELKEYADSEMWRAGVTVRSLRPENQ